MGLVYLPAQELGNLSSRKSSLDTEQLDMSNGISSANGSSRLESVTDISTMPLSGTMCEVSTGDRGLDEWILSLEDSPVNLSLSLAKGKPNMMNGICGLTHSDSLARYDQDTHCWRTSQGCLLTGTYDEYSQTWPRSGMIANGMLWERPTWVQTTEENDSGVWLGTPRATEAIRSEEFKRGRLPSPEEFVKMWPTPDCSDRRSAKSKQQGLSNAVKMFPTPAARDWKDNGQSPAELERNSTTLATLAGGQLNPRWVEWLMGWPDGWTDLNASEMDGCPNASQQFSESVERWRNEIRKIARA